MHRVSGSFLSLHRMDYCLFLSGSVFIVFSKMQHKIFPRNSLSALINDAGGGGHLLTETQGCLVGSIAHLFVIHEFSPTEAFVNKILWDLLV